MTLWPDEVELSAYVRDLDDYAMKSLVPPPIAVRVDQLVEVLMKGVRTLGDVSQGELVAALIQRAPHDPKKLATTVVGYRHAQVHEAFLDADQAVGPYSLPPRRIGRPKR